MGRFMNRLIKTAALTLAVSFCAGLLCACGDDTEQTVIPADYGTYGRISQGSSPELIPTAPHILRGAAGGRICSAGNEGSGL